MSERRVFPFDFVTHGSRVVLYGAGKNGKDYWKQNREFNWCNIILVVDKNYEFISDFPWSVCSPEEIGLVDSYDYVVVSISAEKPRREAIDALIGAGVPREKIIAKTEGYFYRDDAEDVLELADDNTEGIRIGYYISRALGEQIIFLAFYDAIRKVESNIHNDVYCPANNTAESVFEGWDGLQNVKYRIPDKTDFSKYDVFFDLTDFIPILKSYRREKICRINPEMAGKIDLLYDRQKESSIDSAVGTYSRLVVVDRARLLGQNRYSLMSMQGIFDIDDCVPSINIAECFYSEYKDMNFERPYVTIHHGASDVMRDGRRQTKIWPGEYFGKLVGLIHEEYGGVDVVQIGADESERINGADRYVFGKQLDVTKYILKNAMCHIDSESGLVHLATSLGTKCFVMFGPTPIWLFGYPQNENIAPEICGECKDLTKDWYVHCIKYDRPECMYSITPEMVLSRLRPYLDEKLKEL